MSEEYVLLIHEPNWNPEAMTAEEWQAGMAGHKAFQDAVVAAGERIVAMSALQPITKATKITPRADGDPLVTDGPFSETAEQVVGFYLVDAEDGGALRAACERFAARGEHIELRRLAD